MLAFAERMILRRACCSPDWLPKHSGLWKHSADHHLCLSVAHAEDLPSRFGHGILVEVLAAGAPGETHMAIADYTESSRTPSLTEEELVLASVLSWAIGLVVDILSRQIRPANNYCLFHQIRICIAFEGMSHIDATYILACSHHTSFSAVGTSCSPSLSDY